jgi:trimethylamine---corrinoid protein Co-methyltransferase
MVTFSNLLTQEQVERVHGAALEILEEVGMLVRNEKARAYFKKYGCKFEPDSEIIKFPRSLIEELRKTFPPKFKFFGREEKYDRTVPDDRPVIITGSSAPNIVDPITGAERRAYSDDIARIAYLVNEMSGYDVFSVSTLAEDASPGYFTLDRLYPSVKNCLKPIRSNAPTRNDAEQILKLGSLIAGSAEAYAKRPFITTHFCPVVSPLTMDYDSTELTIFFADKGLPVYPSIVPNAGLTSPMTLIGTVAQACAELLAIGSLMQMVKPGTPLIFSSLPTVTDMRTGAYASGGIECAMLHMACAQMARFYDIPSGGYIGLSNAKINDAQAGYETGMSVVAGFLGGADMFNMAGLLDALTAFDYGKAVTDNEIALMLKRLGRGIEFSDENLSLDVIKQIGPAGNFITHEQTMDLMKVTGLLTEISDRDTREGWMNRGALDTQTRALERVREILSFDNPAVFSAETDALIRAEFPGLVAGNSTLFEGWERVTQTEADRHMRRERRHARV